MGKSKEKLIVHMYDAATSTMKRLVLEGLNSESPWSDINTAVARLGGEEPNAWIVQQSSTSESGVRTNEYREVATGRMCFLVVFPDSGEWRTTPLTAKAKK